MACKAPYSIMAKVIVGTCGFPTARKRCYSSLDAIELQETFYDMPERGRMEVLRKEAPEGFIFTVKVFQAITHPLNSPTWRRAKRFRPSGNPANYGYLRPTRENLEAWGQFYESVKPLNPAFFVFQTPPSMKLDEGLAKDVIDFFKTIGLGEKAGWEPRGLSYERPDLIRRIIEEAGVVHIVDPFKRGPLVQRELAYLRLHGIGPGEVNYSYKYTDDDLRRLKEFVFSLNANTIYVMFNNVHMFEDAVRFKSLLSK